MIKNVRQLMSLIKYDLKNSRKDFIRRFHKLCQKRGINFIKDALIFFTYNFYFDLKTAGFYLELGKLNKSKVNKVHSFIFQNIVTDEYTCYLVNNECQRILDQCQKHIKNFM